MMPPADLPPPHALHVAAECMRDGAAIRRALATSRKRRGELRRAAALDEEADALVAASDFLAQLAQGRRP